MRVCCCRVTNSVTQDVDTDSIRLRLSVPEANVIPQLTSLLHSTGKPLQAPPLSSEDACPEDWWHEINTIPVHASPA